MINVTCTDVRALPGDCAFLIDDGKTAILYDTGFGFTGYTIADHIKRELGDRPLDYILLTHSHYDHVLGAPYIAKRYPNVKIIAGEYAKTIFDKPSARAIMRDLDRKYAVTCGVHDYEDLIDELKVDIIVRDGDVITCGDMSFTVINLPGHTKCSVGFYLNENKLLLGSETLGVYFGGDSYLPFYLVGYKMTLESFQKVKKLDIENILLPHYGLVSREEAKQYLKRAEQAVIDIAEEILKILKKGGTTEEVIEYYKATYYKENVRPTYPIDAFYLNTGIMIELIKKELMCS